MTDMDFGELLDYAKQNEKPAKEVRCYRTSFAPPKKEQKSKTLSANIQKFLARKEEEERQKTMDADKKRDELLALRAQDSKANKRVRAMLKSTKAANKAVIDDARDDVNTAVTMAGPCQPDEDDYGYVSQEASAFYNKLMDKYVSTPSEDPKFAKKAQTVKDLVSTKDRVRMALLKEEEEEAMPHKRKRRKVKEETKEKDDNICYDAPDREVFEREPKSSYHESSYDKPEPEVKKKRPPAPPPINFADLLKVAAQKQFEPIKIEKKESNGDERPMTKKQKEEYMREKQHRMRKEEMARMAAAKGKEKPERSVSQPQVEEEARTGSAPKLPSIPRIPKLNGAKSAPETNSRMSGNDPEQQMRRRESQPSSSREGGQVKQRLPDSNRPLSSSRPPESGRPISSGRPSESGRPINSSRPSASASEPECRSNEVRKSKVRDSYQDAKPSPAQCVPSSKEKKAAFEEKNLHREPPRPAIKEERRLSNPQPKPVIKDERSQMKPASKPVIREERSLSNASPKPVIRDDRKQPSDPTRPPIKEERRPNPPESSRVPGKYVKAIGGAISSRGDLPQRGDGGSLKTSSNPTRRVEEKPSKGAPSPSSGNSLLKDRLTGPNSQSQSSKASSGSNPQVRKEVRTAAPVQRQSSAGVASQSQRPGNSSATAPVQRQNNPGVQRPSNPGAQRPSNPGAQRPSNPGAQRPSNPDALRPSNPVAQRPSNPGAQRPSNPGAQRPSNPGAQRSSNPGVQRQSNPGAPAKQPPPSDRPSKALVNKPQAMGSQGPSRDAPRGPPPPERRREPVGRGDVRRPMMPPGRGPPGRGPPGGRFLPPGRPGGRQQEMRRPAKRRIESDDEYDSELDDFIDDGPEEGEDYSKYIKEIFGYDKSRYTYIDEEDEDECMESNFAQQMKEEFVSTKLGLLEDLEDIKKEQMEKQRKKGMMKKKKVL